MLDRDGSGGRDITVPGFGFYLAIIAGIAAPVAVVYVIGVVVIALCNPDRRLEIPTPFGLFMVAERAKTARRDKADGKKGNDGAQVVPGTPI